MFPSPSAPAPFSPAVGISALDSARMDFSCGNEDGACEAASAGCGAVTSTHSEAASKMRTAGRRNIRLAAVVPIGTVTVPLRRPSK